MDLTNDQFVTLVERSVLAGDEAATDLLVRYFLAIIHPKARSLRGANKDDLVSALLEKAFKASRRTLEKPTEPGKQRNYVVRAITNAFVDWLRKNVAPPDELATEMVQAAEEEEILNRQLLSAFTASRTSVVAHKAAQVIEVMYRLGTTESEACELLHFTTVERQTVTRTLHRWRRSPTSPLRDLVDDEGGHW